MDTSGLIQRIASTITSSDDGDGFLEWLCPQLLEAGLPLWRVGVSMPALDTLASSFTMVWSSAGVAKSHTGHGDDYRQAFLNSPIRALLEQDLTYGRWRLEDPFEGDAFPILGEFRDGGGTDYVLHIVTFAPGTALRGAALSFTTRRPGGFTDANLIAIRDLVPILGLAMAKIALAHTLRRILGTYVGVATTEQVLEGRILRGEGRTIWAAILLVDLRGFTTLTDRSNPADVVTWLDEHLEALGRPVLESGGEILKFLGDGFLATFPITAPDASPCLDCGRALNAALAARRANAVLNARREAQGLPALEADLVLHFGEVVYGNVGTRDRLDFTVIGRAVNEASRIEKSCSALDRSILISDSFAARCAHNLVPVGDIALRGLARTQRVWTLPQDSAGTAFEAISAA